MLQKDIAEVLGQFKDPRVIKPLIDLLDSQYHYVRNEAARSLEKVTGENYGQRQSKWLEWWLNRSGSDDYRNEDYQIGP
jgi:HEAT repeat protein